MSQKEKLIFPCHSSYMAVEYTEHLWGKRILGCPVCRNEYIVDYDRWTIEPLLSTESLTEDRITIHRILKLLEGRNDVEIKKDRAGKIVLYSITKQVYKA